MAHRPAHLMRTFKRDGKIEETQTEIHIAANNDERLQRLIYYSLQRAQQDDYVRVHD